VELAICLLDNSRGGLSRQRDLGGEVCPEGLLLQPAPPLVQKHAYINIAYTNITICPRYKTSPTIQTPIQQLPTIQIYHLYTYTITNTQVQSISYKHNNDHKFTIP